MPGTIKINGDFVTLGQLLQMMAIVSSGGMVKAFLSQHTVYVNGQIENRRGKKLYVGDVVLIPAKGKIKLV